jgi:hypothetical protein
LLLQPPPITTNVTTATRIRFGFKVASPQVHLTPAHRSMSMTNREMERFDLRVDQREWSRDEPAMKIELRTAAVRHLR